MDSAFQAETGFYAHPLGLGTITVPRGWEGRLIPFGREDGLLNVWALEIHDLAATKLMAGRDKDFEFLERCSIRAFASSPLYLPASRASVRVFLPTRSQTGSASWLSASATGSGTTLPALSSHARKPQTRANDERLRLTFTKHERAQSRNGGD